MKDQKKLAPEQLTWTVPRAFLKFKSSEDVEPTFEIIGQERAVAAIRLGLGLEGMGYNIFVTGLSGTGRTTTIQTMVSASASKQETPGDWVYVNNFRDSNVPGALRLPPGGGSKLSAAMEKLLSTLRAVIPGLMTSGTHQEAGRLLSEKYQERQKALLSGFEKLLKEKGFAMVQVQLGLMTKPEIFPLVKGKPVPPGELDQRVESGEVDAREAERLTHAHGELMGRLEVVFQEVKDLQAEHEKKLKELRHASIHPTLNQLFSELKNEFPEASAAGYFDDILAHLFDHLDLFLEGEGEKPEGKPGRDPFLPFKVNVLVDNAAGGGRPVVIEPNPTYANLFGTVERRFEDRTAPPADFTHIRAGSLLKANGGYLVVNFTDLLREPGVWPALRHTLRHEKLFIVPEEASWWTPPSPLRPEPVELNVKVIVIGDLDTYQTAYDLDEDFKKIFKVLAEFDSSMDLTKASFDAFVRLLRKILDEEKLLPFSSAGIARVAEHAVRLAGRRGKLSTRFDAVADILREAHYWAREARAEEVGADHVAKAVAEREKRHGLHDEKQTEMILQDILHIATSGRAEGQVNGLTVYDMGYTSFGKPVKITAAASLGAEGIVSIEREAELAGHVFMKGSLILSGWLRETFTADKPLSVHASIAFEQSYGGIEGDSASIAEIYALLSRLAGVPAAQGIAVTGSMDQKGRIQPVGGINVKIEGFFDLARARGLDGSHGVVIPAGNVEDLMLKAALVDAVRKGLFSVWALHRVEDGIPILLGLPAGTRDKKGAFPPRSLYGRVDTTLKRMARIYKGYK